VCTAAAGGPEWTGPAEAVLSRLLVLDQFPRTAYRGSAESFVHEELATQISNDAIDAGLDKVRYSGSIETAALASDNRKMAVVCRFADMCAALSALAPATRSISKWFGNECNVAADTVLLLHCALLLLLLLLLPQHTHTTGAHAKPAAVHVLASDAQ
jgi:Bacterial protein of unknown function (DUF924)